MLGYLLGAYLTSITVGLVLVFSLQGSSFASTAQHTVSPAEDIVVGAILLVVAFVLATGRDAPIRERWRARGGKSLGVIVVSVPIHFCSIQESSP